MYPRKPADVALIYSDSERGFALASMRLLTRVRCYIQCPIDEGVDSDLYYLDQIDPTDQATIRPD
jgi:hypothetical protein